MEKDTFFQEAYAMSQSLFQPQAGGVKIGKRNHLSHSSFLPSQQEIRTVTHRLVSFPQAFPRLFSAP